MKEKKTRRKKKIHKSNMKKSTKGEAVLSACQIQATRLNKLEYRRLQINVNLMHDDLKTHLARLERQAQSIKYHYENYVRVIKPNPTYQLWKQRHSHGDSKNWLESRKLQQRSKSNTYQHIPSINKISSESIRPLLLLHDDGAEKPVESIINLNENFLRQQTGSVRKNLANQQPKSPISTERSIHSNNSIRSQKSASSASSVLPPIKSSSSRKLEQTKFIPSTTTQKSSTLDALCRIALQNQTAYKLVGQNKEFAIQNRALKGTIRSTCLVK